MTSEKTSNPSIQEKAKLKWTIFIASFFYMGSFVIFPALSSISQAFPGASDLTIQLCSSAFGFAAFLCALAADLIGRILSRRGMILLGYSIMCCCAIGGFLLQFSILTLLFWCFFSGVGVGIYVPATSALLMDHFSGAEQASVAGRQNTFVNLGGIVLSLLGGFLSAWDWRATFLSFLLAVPILLLCIWGLPKTNSSLSHTQSAQEKSAFRDRIPPTACLAYIGMDMLFVVVYMTYSTNFSLLLSERIGADQAATLSGLASALFMFAGGCAGFVFHRLTKRFHEYLLVIACLLLCLGFLTIFLGKSLPWMLVGTFIGGTSFSMIVPQTQVVVTMRVNPLQSLMASSLLMGLAPNIGGVISPLVFTRLSMLMGHTDVAFRFLFASLAAAGLAVLYALVIHLVRKKERV